MQVVEAMADDLQPGCAAAEGRLAPPRPVESLECLDKRRNAWLRQHAGSDQVSAARRRRAVACKSKFH